MLSIGQTVRVHGTTLTGVVIDIADGLLGREFAVRFTEYTLYGVREQATGTVGYYVADELGV